MELDSFFINFIIGAVVFYAGYKFGYNKCKEHISSDFEDFMSEIVSKIGDGDDTTEVVQAHEKSDIKHLRHEVDKGIHYFYEQDTDEFICQGSTLEEAAESFDERFKKSMAVFTDFDTKESLAFVNGDVASAVVRKITL